MPRFAGPVNCPNTFILSCYRYGPLPFLKHVQGCLEIFKKSNLSIASPLMLFVSDHKSFSEPFEAWCMRTTHRPTNACCVCVLCARCAVDCTVSSPVVWEWLYLFVVLAEVLGSQVLWNLIIENLRQISSHLRFCCNFSVGVALNVRFTKNGMCAKNNTHMYVARTSNNRVILASDV